MADAIFTFTTKTVAETRDDILRSYRSRLARLGINVSVAPDTEIYQRAEAFARQVAVASANTSIKADEMMPDTATGEESGGNLDRWGASFRMQRRPETGSAGLVVFDAVSASAVVLGAQLVDGAGQFFEVTVGSSYADGAYIPIQALSTGKLTNLAAGTVLRWVVPPGTASESVVVGASGLTGGATAETDEAYRSRILNRLGHPPASGNWAHVALLAEESNPLVQKAFVYPALQGPGTVHFAVTGAPTETSKTRDVSSVVVTSLVQPYVEGLYPEHAYFVGTSVTNQPVDVAFGLALPSSPLASPPGPGGGWFDASPWPTLSSYSSGGADVTAKTSDTAITVNAQRAPIAGVSRVAFLNYTTWELHTATVLSTAGSGPYVVTLDSPLVGIAVGDWVFPDCANLQAYIDAMIDEETGAFAAMGPGEKTASSPILSARGFRHPTPSLEWPYSLGPVQLRKLSDTGSEVLDTSYLYRSAITPTVPGAVTGNPSIFVPQKIAFYPTA